MAYVFVDYRFVAAGDGVNDGEGKANVGEWMVAAWRGCRKASFRSRVAS